MGKDDEIEKQIVEEEEKEPNSPQLEGEENGGTPPTEVEVEEKQPEATEIEADKKEEVKENGETQTPEAEIKVEEEKPTPPQQPAATFTQEQVNELVGRARQEGRKSAAQEFLRRYGVDNDDELNSIFGKGQSYDILNDDYQTQTGEFKRLSAENALLKSKVPENRWEDVMLILTGKGLDVTPDNIMEMAKTHPEWVGNGMEQNASVQTIGAEQSNEAIPPETGKVRAIGSTIKKPKTESDESEEDKIMRWMGAL